MRGRNFFLHRSRESLRHPRDRGVVAGVVNPSSALLGPHESGAPQERHVVGHGGLGESDLRLDVARAEPALIASDQIAAGAPFRLQEVEDLQARRIAERLAHEDDVDLRLHAGSPRCISTALEGHAERNSMDCCTSAGADARSRAAKPSRGKNSAAVSVRR